MSDVPERRESPRIVGVFTVLDGTAAVTGAAVASVHVRNVIEDYANLAAIGSLPVWLTFIWLSITSAGPFLFLLRRFGTRLPDYPRRGDLIWLLFGLPWLISALVRSVAPAGRSAVETMNFWLTVGLSIASAAALGSLVATLSPRRSRVASIDHGPASWTDVVGWTICVAWPIQFGMLLVVSTAD